MGLFDKIKKAGTDFLQDGELIKKAMKQESFTNEELSLFSEKHNGQTPEEYRVEQEQLKAERAEKNVLKPKISGSMKLLIQKNILDQQNLHQIFKLMKSTGFGKSPMD